MCVPVSFLREALLGGSLGGGNNLAGDPVGTPPALNWRTPIKGGIQNSAASKNRYTRLTPASTSVQHSLGICIAKGQLPCVFVL